MRVAWMLLALPSLETTSIARLLFGLRFVAAALLTLALIGMSLFDRPVGALAAAARAARAQQRRDRGQPALGGDYPLARAGLSSGFRQRRLVRLLLGYRRGDQSFCVVVSGAGGARKFCTHGAPGGGRGAGLCRRLHGTSAALQAQGVSGHIVGFEHHVIGMWLNFMLAGVFLCMCLLTLAGLLRQRERELATQRERLLREDAIVSVAPLAAGAAHALNTPLSTIAVAAESMADHPSLDAGTREDVAVIQTQTDLCARQLRRLMEAQDRRGQPSCPLGDYAERLMQRWRTARPEIEMMVEGVSALAHVNVKDDAVLAQALFNLLDNAADASLDAGHSRIQVRWCCEAGPSTWLVPLIDDEENPEQAISAARRTRVDAVVLDLRLGEHSGMALIGTLQAANPQARILMLTGYASIASVIHAIKQGAFNYLPKPATARQILAALTDSEQLIDNTLPDGRTSLRRLEWEHIQHVFAQHDHNVSATAQALGMHRCTLQRKLAKKPVRE